MFSRSASEYCQTDADYNMIYLLSVIALALVTLSSPIKFSCLNFFEEVVENTNSGIIKILDIIINIDLVR